MPLAPATCDEQFHVSHHAVGPFTILHNRYPAEYLLEEHEHEVATVYLVLSGSHEERSRRSSTECSRGSVIFSPRGARHSDHYGTAGGEAFLIELPQVVLARAADGGVRLDEPLHLAGSDAAALMRRLFDEAGRADELTPLAFEALLLHVLVTLRRDAHRNGTAVPPWLRRVRELMHDRFAERLTLDEMATAAGVHPVHLATTFHRCFGLTFGAYLRGLRVEHARRALLETTSPLADIALASGFCDQSHLSRVFRETTGTSPAQYRRNARG
ncbi:MAG: helix-turn-helix domain-containing protein [Thermoanaerobaculia bacterium]